jgi:hypothetical protein
LPYQAGPGPVKPLPLMCIDRYAVTYRWALLEVGASERSLGGSPRSSAIHGWQPGSDRRGDRGGPSRMSLGKVVLTPVRVCLPVSLLCIDGGRACCCRAESRVRILTHCRALYVVFCDHPQYDPMPPPSTSFYKASTCFVIRQLARLHLRL